MENIKNKSSRKNTATIPAWRRYTLTIEEAAGYYHIGENKLRTRIDEHPNNEILCYEQESRFDQEGKVRTLFRPGNGALTISKQMRNPSLPSLYDELDL